MPFRVHELKEDILTPLFPADTPDMEAGREIGCLYGIKTRKHEVGKECLLPILDTQGCKEKLLGAWE